MASRPDGESPIKIVGITTTIWSLNRQGVLKYLTRDPVLRKQFRLLKRRFHAASLRGSCGSPLGSTSNPWKTQELRIRAPRRSEGGESQVKSQRLIQASVLRKYKTGLKQDLISAKIGGSLFFKYGIKRAQRPRFWYQSRDNEVFPQYSYLFGNGNCILI
jgi:hypothetical protein